MTSYCVFNVGDRRIGLPMTSVREILETELVSPTPLPLVPSYVHGLFNLRGQVLPFLDLAPFVGATRPAVAGPSDRAVIIERGKFRFGTLGQRIDTLAVAPDQLRPLADAALHPALDAEAQTLRGNFHIVHLDRLEACLSQALHHNYTHPELVAPAVTAPAQAAPAPAPAPAALAVEPPATAPASVTAPAISAVESAPAAPASAPELTAPAVEPAPAPASAPTPAPAATAPAFITDPAPAAKLASAKPLSPAARTTPLPGTRAERRRSSKTKTT